MTFLYQVIFFIVYVCISSSHFDFGVVRRLIELSNTVGYLVLKVLVELRGLYEAVAEACLLAGQQRSLFKAHEARCMALVHGSSGKSMFHLLLHLVGQHG